MQKKLLLLPSRMMMIQTKTRPADLAHLKSKKSVITMKVTLRYQLRMLRVNEFAVIM